MVFDIKICKRYYDYICLTIIYLGAHGYLLIASGKWWDDWCHEGLSIDAFISWTSQMGRPDLIWQYYLYNFSPESTYRIATFFVFYISIFCFSYILKRVANLDEKQRFYICALYATFPVNDARILFSTFPYTVGWFFFIVAFTHLVYMLYNQKMNIWGRGINLILFFLSFTLNSNLVYYITVVFLVVWYNRNIKCVKKYIDYLMLPVVFFITKTTLFPAYGLYDGYNSLTFSSLVKAVVFVIPADLYVLNRVLNGYCGFSNEAFILSGLIMFVAIAFCCNKYRCHDTDGRKITLSDSFIFMGGVVLLSIGLFAYVAVRGSFFINTTGVAGRDAILSAPGGALIVYSFIKMIFSKKVAPYIISFFVLCGVVSFNNYYLDYQWDYYKQIGFQYNLITHHHDIECAQDILYINNDKRKINISSFYALNANATKVYGDETRFIRDVTTQKRSGEFDFDSFVSNSIYHMSEYNSSYNNIDLIIFHSFNVDKKM